MSFVFSTAYSFYQNVSAVSRTFFIFLFLLLRHLRSDIHLIMPDMVCQLQFPSFFAFFILPKKEYRYSRFCFNHLLYLLSRKTASISEAADYSDINTSENCSDRYTCSSACQNCWYSRLQSDKKTAIHKIFPAQILLRSQAFCLHHV